MAVGDSPVLEALVELNKVSLARTDLDPRSPTLVRIAAIVAVDPATSSYLLHVGPSIDAGATAPTKVVGPQPSAEPWTTVDSHDTQFGGLSAHPRVGDSQPTGQKVEISVKNVPVSRRTDE